MGAEPVRPICENLANLARPPRLERGTPGLEGRCSIQLSYGRTKRTCQCSKPQDQPEHRPILRTASPSSRIGTVIAPCAPLRPAYPRARRHGPTGRVSARVPGAVPVPEHPPRDHHRALPLQGRGLRGGGRHPDRRHRDRHPRAAGPSRSAALGVLLPVPVLDRVFSGSPVLRQPEEGGVAADRPGPHCRGQRARCGHRRHRHLRLRRRPGSWSPVGRHDPVRRARYGPQRHRRATDRGRLEGRAHRECAACRRDHVWVWRSRPDLVPDLAWPEDHARGPERRSEGAGEEALGRQGGRRGLVRGALRVPRIPRRERAAGRLRRRRAGRALRTGSVVCPAHPARRTTADARSRAEAAARRPDRRLCTTIGVRGRRARHRAGGRRSSPAVGTRQDGGNRDHEP